MMRAPIAATVFLFLAACEQDASSKDSSEQSTSKTAEAKAVQEKVMPPKERQQPAKGQQEALNKQDVSNKENTEGAHAGLTTYAVDEVHQLLDEKKVTPVDANDDEIRKKFGLLPGAVALSNSRTFELSELPEDKSSELVFYCGSEMCRAAPRAARKAEAAGYENVRVMPAGIKGWVEAKKPVQDQS